MRRIRQTPASFAAVLGLSSVAAVAAAAPARQGVRLDPLQPASPESAFVRAEGPHAPAESAVEIALGLGLEYTSKPLHAVGVDAAGEEHPLGNLVDHALLLRLGASIFPASWIGFDLSVPIGVYVKGEQESPVSYGGEQAQPPSSASGLGDPRFGVHVRPIDESSFGLLVGGRVWAPIGSERAYLSDRRLRGEIDVGGAGQVGTLLYGCTLSVAPGLFAGRDGDRFAAALAAHALPMPAFSLGIEPTVALVHDVGANDEGRIGVIVEPLAAMRLRAGGLRVGLAAGPVFGGVAGSGEFRGILHLAFVGSGSPPKPRPVPTKPADRDLDGIVDAGDACPDEAGPDSREAGQRGCPALDGDNDGVRDNEDACPERTGVKHADAKANGCPDGDNDGLPDPLDTCPTEPGSDPFGCPRYARLGGNRFRITPPIKFTGDQLTPEGKAALEEVAATMRANPKIEQVSIGIGTRGASADSSDKRARAILLVFRAGNLDSNRYEVVLRDDLRAGNVEIKIVK
jgi:hypothetical protein